MISNYWIVFIILTACIYVSVKTGKLTNTAALTGGLIALLIFTGAGYTGLAMIGTFFLLGSAATAWKIKTKETIGVAERNQGKRTSGQVIANAGMAGILGLLIWVYPAQTNLFRLMIAAAFASATADTLSSELGNVYGSRFINIISLKKDKRGSNGVISLEGTLFGIVGSAIIGLLYTTGFGWDQNFILIILSGTAGNIADSILGATLERDNYLGNNAVNFLNTLVAALLAMALNIIY